LIEGVAYYEDEGLLDYFYFFDYRMDCEDFVYCLFLASLDFRSYNFDHREWKILRLGVIKKGDVLKKSETMERMTPMMLTMAISSPQGHVNAGTLTLFWTIENRHNRTFKIP
jgi:hypothetical protein